MIKDELTKTSQNALVKKITESVYRILIGEHSPPIVMSEPFHDNEAAQLVQNINRLLKELQELSESISAVAKGHLYFEPPKGRTKAQQHFNGLHSGLSHLTWQIQRVAEGDLSQKLNTSGELANGLNSMTLQFKEALQKIESQKIKLEEANRMLEECRNIDLQTGLFNQKYFYTAFDAAWRHGQRDHKPVSLILMEIDFFKPYNDAYGFQRGGECLKRIAEKIKWGIRRPGDIAARHFGEDFAIILPDTELQGAVTVAENIRRAVETLGLEHRFSPVSGRTVTISAGCAVAVPSHNSSYVTLITIAGNALDIARKKGHNTVKSAQ